MNEHQYNQCIPVYKPVVHTTTHKDNSMDKVIRVLKIILAHALVFSALVVVGFVVAILIVAAKCKLSRLCPIRVGEASFLVCDSLFWLIRGIK